MAKPEPPDQSLTASCPISLRSVEQRGEFGNRIGNMFVALGTDIADPVERFRGILAETANTKAHAGRHERSATRLSPTPVCG